MDLIASKTCKACSVNVGQSPDFEIGIQIASDKNNFFLSRHALVDAGIYCRGYLVEFAPELCAELIGDDFQSRECPQAQNKCLDRGNVVRIQWV